MRHSRAPISWLLVMVLCGCEHRTVPAGPTLPPPGQPVLSGLPPPSDRPPSDPPPLDDFAQEFTAVEVNQTVRSVVSTADPPCADEPEWPCQFFRVTPPIDGTLEVFLSHSRGNLDLNVRDGAGEVRWAPIRMFVWGGWTYQIAVVEYAFPGLAFELRSTLIPRGQ